jgi:hypothetical protein
LMGVDIGGNGTDEKIPVKLFIKDMEEMLKYGIQTDGSSVELQGIADLGKLISQEPGYIIQVAYQEPVLGKIPHNIPIPHSFKPVFAVEV